MIVDLTNGASFAFPPRLVEGLHDVAPAEIAKVEVIGWGFGLHWETLDLNPIEQVFAKLKHLLRKAAERTHEQTWRRIGSLLNAFPPHECANYLKNSGYRST